MQLFHQPHIFFACTQKLNCFIGAVLMSKMSMGAENGQKNQDGDCNRVINPHPFLICFTGSSEG